ncbi:hypothetical protein QFC19_003884 [Naganishia cerealis]|uniref:Uncharacterized protein n=1 Tax=Naganishia cerealis TaxID=610337 RepID=A0ACC2VZX0_9TREE|nr:hypothetical protein QFC19_003884 [Naganishia cerealis]
MATLPALDIHGKNTPHQTIPSSSSQSPDEEKGSVDFPSPADSEVDLLAKYYEPPDSWENKHRWDPKATWTEEEVKKLTRKLDWRVTLVACICFAALQLDRGNIGNALSDGMLKDLNLSTNQYNYGQTLFYAAFLSAELPSQLISKKLGSDVWIPIQMMSWSVIAISQVGLKNVHGFYATRALLGLLEGEGLTLRSLIDSLWDYDLWPVYAVRLDFFSWQRCISKLKHFILQLGLTTYLAPATVNAYFSLTLKSL